MVAAGAEGAEAGRSDVQFALSGRIQQLVELQNFLLDGVEVAQPLPAFDLPLPLDLGPQALLLRFSQPQLEDLMKVTKKRESITPCKTLIIRTSIFDTTLQVKLGLQSSQRMV